MGDQEGVKQVRVITGRNASYGDICTYKRDLPSGRMQSVFRLVWKYLQNFNQFSHQRKEQRFDMYFERSIISKIWYGGRRRRWEGLLAHQ